ncbi:hypothetical protein [Okeania sp. SIO2B9]|uniref:hypothetical protein n=1 Tax=Okeania sp. SIO2B9 TaxID=2607782 RepID=UPI00257DF730|nr:hypothetical protein [Okeania sp. SIO2B9]
MGRWRPTPRPSPSQEGNIEKDLAMALVMEHFFIPNLANLMLYQISKSLLFIFTALFI